MNDIIKRGHVHLLDAITTQSGLLWLQNLDLNKTELKRTPVDIHLLQEGMIHRIHRVAEELDIVHQVEQHFVPRNQSANSLLIDIQMIKVKATFRDDGHNIYHYARETEVKAMDKLVLELNKLKEAPSGDERLRKAEAQVARHKATIDNLFGKRVYASLASIMLYN